MEISFEHVSSSFGDVTAVNQRFNRTGSVEVLPNTGRPVTVLTEERIQDMVDTNPRLSIRQGSIQVSIGTSRYHPAT